jgi:hypothetical protein
MVLLAFFAHIFEQKKSEQTRASKTIKIGPQLCVFYTKSEQQFFIFATQKNGIQKEWRFSLSSFSEIISLSLLFILLSTTTVY